jgi:hypothetical protein
MYDPIYCLFNTYSRLSALPHVVTLSSRYNLQVGITDKETEISINKLLGIWQRDIKLLQSMVTEIFSSQMENKIFSSAY